MPFRPNTRALTALLGLLTAMGPLATDMYLPSLPIMAREFGVTADVAQYTLSSFLLGFAAGQLIYGPLGDRFGRRPVLLAGLALFTVASAVCAIAPTADALIAARFVQALGGAGPVVLARAIVRDLYSGPRAGRELALMGMVMGVVPAIAPVFGAGLEATFGWRSSFLAMFLSGVFGWGVVWRALPETLHTRAARLNGPREMLATYAVLLRDKGYRAHGLLMSIAYGGLFTWISASSFVLQDLYGLSEFGFALAFTTGVAGFVTGSWLGARLVVRHGIGRTLGVGCVFLLAGGLLLLATVWIGFGHPAEVVLPIMVYLVGIGLVMPQGMAGALQPFPERAGAASSLVGFVQMSFAALMGVVIGHMLGGSAMPLAVIMAAIGLVTAALYCTTREARALVG
jgi:DHA1 family bicyclomycin/chloramphenicol resistance-like MFS transporter